MKQSPHLTTLDNTTRHGYTGHEMLDGVGLIHMNGRVYDPTVGRFLSVDPIVRDVAASQSWNGYGYVEGQVLSATDPSGYACGRLSTGSCKYVPEESSIETIEVRASRLRWELNSAMDRLDMWAEGNGGGIRDVPLEGGGGTTGEPQRDVRAEVEARNGNWSYIRRVAGGARDAGIPLPPDIFQVFKDIGQAYYTVVTIFSVQGR